VSRAGISVLLSAALFVAIGGCPAPGEDEDEGEGEAGSEGPPPGPPVILDGTERVVEANQREDISIAVADLCRAPESRSMDARGR
jgi:hypothetical protein